VKLGTRSAKKLPDDPFGALSVTVRPTLDESGMVQSGVPLTSWAQSGTPQGTMGQLFAPQPRALRTVAVAAACVVGAPMPKTVAKNAFDGRRAST
jgi:hypothetical protein